MKRYRLLKDSPYVKAGAVFVREIIRATEIMVLESPKEERPGLIIDKIMDFDEWFEEVGEPEWVYYINAFGGVVDNVRVADLPGVRTSLKSTGNYFETKEEAEAYLKYLKAKAIIKQDTKGFKPNWKNCENKYYGYWNSGKDSLEYLVSYITKHSDICFKTEEDIKESFKKHRREWKIYLTYHQ